MMKNFRNEAEVREQELKVLGDLFGEPGIKYGYIGKYDEDIDAYVFVKIIYKGKSHKYNDNSQKDIECHQYNLVKGKYDENGYKCFIDESMEINIRGGSISDLNKFVTHEFNDLIKKIKQPARG